MIDKISHDTEKIYGLFQKNDDEKNMQKGEDVKNEEAAASREIAAAENMADGGARDSRDTVNISEEGRKLAEELRAKADAVDQRNPYADEPAGRKAASDPAEEAPEEETDENGDEGGLWGIVDTSEVEAEIEGLKKNVKQLEQQIKSASDEEERQELESRLMQAKSELSLKDNDGYIRAHAKTTYSEDDPR